MNLHPTHSTAPVVVYLDVKSPYAYLAIEPTRRLEQQLGEEFDWRPLVLDIPSYLGSAELDSAGNVAAQNRSAAQWGAVKYSYYDCRRYASVNHTTLRGTTKIWDTHLVAAVWLWLKQHAPNALPKFIDQVYAPFWRRELDIEDPAALAQILVHNDIDADTCLSWSLTDGQRINQQFEQAVFDAGIYGVPSYVIENEHYFGREHLPRIAWQLLGNVGPAPDIAYQLQSDAEIKPVESPRVTVGVDNSIDSLLALPGLKSLNRECGIPFSWRRIGSQQPDDLLSPESGNKRGLQHRFWREENWRRNNARYAPNINLDNLEQLIRAEIERLDIQLDRTGSDFISPLPGIHVRMNDEEFIGRQHLPLIKARLLGQ